MNRRILCASVLSVLIAMGVSLLLDWLYPAPQPKKEVFLAEETTKTLPVSEAFPSVMPAAAPLTIEEIPFETEVFTGTFSTAGASIVSLGFKNYADEAGEMINLVDDSIPEAGLTQESIVIDGTPLPKDLVYRLLTSQNDTFVFITEVMMGEDLITLTRTYRLEPTGYLFALETQVAGVAAERVSLTVSFVEHLPGYGKTDPTMAHAFTTKFVDVKKAQSFQARWAGASNRYLAMAVVPSATTEISWEKTEGGSFQTSWQAQFTAYGDGISTSVIHMYLGPKDSVELVRYDEEKDNPFGLHSLRLESLVQTGWFSWVQSLLAWIMGFFYQVIPNWGVAIILLTVLVKVLLYPAALKAHLSTASMQKVQPEIKALQEKYKGEPARMQQEMQKIYQKHGVNPLGGCLPVLIQIPIFIALYGLLNNYLQLRGAVFVPGWITDLSLSESILHFNFTVPFLDWNDIRLLPFIMLLTQFASGWINMNNAQTAAMSSQQQKLLFYGMPTIFFFVLYNMASGLLIYWIVNNLLTVVQQLYLTRYLK